MAARAGPSGPHHPRGAEVELTDLRRRLASSENVGTIKSIGNAASELALVAPESLLSYIADFVDRCAEKLERLGVASPKATRKRLAQIVVDEELGPITVKKDRLLTKLREVHGEPRADLFEASP